MDIRKNKTIERRNGKKQYYRKKDRVEYLVGKFDANVDSRANPGDFWNSNYFSKACMSSVSNDPDVNRLMKGNIRLNKGRSGIDERYIPMKKSDFQTEYDYWLYCEQYKVVGRTYGGH